jgi:hypothetical protein
MEAKECGGGEGIGWVKTGDGAALEEEEWGRNRGEATGCQVPGWVGCAGCVRSPLWVFDHWISMFRTAPIDFSGTIIARARFGIPSMLNSACVHTNY